MGTDATPPKPPALDPKTVPVRIGSAYPASFAEAVAGRRKRVLGDAFGLTGFGVNLVRLPAGCASSQRHWHSREDEFIYVLEGELVLLTDAGEQPLAPGMAAGFPAGSGDGHHLVNRSASDAVYLEVGERDPTDTVEYSDIDLRALPAGDGNRRFVRRDGRPY